MYATKSRERKMMIMKRNSLFLFGGKEQFLNDNYTVSKTQQEYLSPLMCAQDKMKDYGNVEVVVTWLDKVVIIIVTFFPLTQSLFERY